MNNVISIQPKEIIKVATSFAIDVPYLILNTKALIRVSTFDVLGNVISQDQFELIKPDYDNWLSDNSLINFVCEKYNFQLPIKSDEQIV